MRSASLFAVAVLAVVLALSSAQNAFAATISLTPSCGGPGTRVTFSGTGFDPLSLPDSCDFSTGGNIVWIDLSTFECQIVGGSMNGAFTVMDVASGKYTVTFRTWLPPGNVMDGEATVEYNTDCPSAVGGLVMPANTLALVAPWIALIGVVGCISTIVVVAKKRGK